VQARVPIRIKLDPAGIRCEVLIDGKPLKLVRRIEIYADARRGPTIVKVELMARDGVEIEGMAGELLARIIDARAEFLKAEGLDEPLIAPTEG